MILFVVLMATGVLLEITAVATTTVRPPDVGTVRFVFSCFIGGAALLFAGLIYGILVVR